MLSLWPHQDEAIRAVLAAVQRGARRLLLTVPTGGGKTVIAGELIATWLEQAMPGIVYTSRRALIDQLSDRMTAHGLPHGIRAAGYAADPDAMLQIASIQTEHSRAIKRQSRTLHDALFCVTDEAHLNKDNTTRKLLDAHEQEGAFRLGLTATPLDLEEIYDELIVAGTNSQLRACGALVAARHYGPDEPDVKKLRLKPGQDPSEKEAQLAMMRPGLFGRVLDWYATLNPDRKPAMLFGPSVGGSKWFAEQFCAAGIKAAHIDGDEVWYEGEPHPSNTKTREALLAASKSGECKVICNRYVMREGIDAPWIEHVIFATIFGSIQTYLQSGGRGLRAAPGKECLIVQDHGGNYWRHDSLNADREWHLSDTASSVAALREVRLRSRRCQRCYQQLQEGTRVCRCGFLNETEPRRCPQCALVIRGQKCPCGYVSNGKPSRPVVMTDGTLKEVGGLIFAPRRVSRDPGGAKKWERVYYAAKNSKKHMTFAQAMAWFATMNNWGYPNPDWPLMPIKDRDHLRAVVDVDVHDLVPRREAHAPD